MTTHTVTWLILVANVAVFIVGVALTAMSYTAYRRSGRQALRIAAVGFGVIAFSTVIGGTYELAIRGVYPLPAEELSVLHTLQTSLIGLGLASLFYSLRNY